jgi:hypothetical protein
MDDICGGLGDSLLDDPFVAAREIVEAEGSALGRGPQGVTPNVVEAGG